ncbi:hypothetical protein OC834_000062 [Tilletia horrida]|nr:hypothetical protein OC834_000062 [Tilletia horrida]
MAHAQESAKVKAQGARAQPRIPTEDVLGRALEDHILREHELDQDAASTSLTPRNIRNHLIKHFKLGNEHALDTRKLFIKNTARIVVERYRAGESRLYPVEEISESSGSSSSPRSEAGPSSSTKTPQRSQPRRLVSDDEDEDEDEEPERPKSKRSKAEGRTPTKAELERRLKANALTLPSDEDEPEEEVRRAEYDSPDSVSEDDSPPSRARKSKKRKAPSPPSSVASASPPPRQRRRRDASPAASRRKAKSTKAAKGMKSKSRNKARLADDSDEADKISDSDMDDDMDEDEEERKPKRRVKTSAKTARGGKKAAGAQSKGKNDRLTMLKKLCVSCGARKVWSTFFRSKGCGGDPDSDPSIEEAQIATVQELLSSIGAWEGMSARQAAKLKEERELAKELAEIGAGLPDSDGEGSSPRGGKGGASSGGAGAGGKASAGPSSLSKVIVSGKRVRKPSAMAMASAEYEDMVSEAKTKLVQAADRAQSGLVSDSDEEGGSGGGSKPALGGAKNASRRNSGRAQVLDDDDDNDDSAASAFEIDDDEDEDDDGARRRRRRRSSKNEEVDDFIVDDDEKIGYERGGSDDEDRNREEEKEELSRKQRSRRLMDSDEDEDESEQEVIPHGEDEVSLHLSTQFDDRRHRDKGELPRRKKAAEDFKDDLRSFANAVNS